MTSLSFLILASLLFTSPVFAADTTPHPELDGILQKIEARHYRWIAIRADVLFFFSGPGDSGSMCGGELLYQRLDERIFLVCADAQKNLAFVFRTLDRRFDLYLPAQNTVYHGSIFDLEDSPEIESHLKARDLYRALKPMTVDPRRTKIERSNPLVTQLDVYNPSPAEETLARRLYLTPEGDVRGELYYGANGRPATEIQRYDFKEFFGRSGIYTSIIFPKKVTILSPETKKGSAIFFSKVTPLDTIDPLDFILRVPPGTKEVFLKEKTLEKRVKVAAPPSQKQMPVYLAVPRKIPEKKTIPSMAKKEELSSKIAEPIVAVTATTVPAKADLPETRSEEIPSPNDTPLPAETLDPSVEPSLEMGP